MAGRTAEASEAIYKSGRDKLTRHARAWRGHPRLSYSGIKDVDGRDKPAMTEEQLNEFNPDLSEEAPLPPKPVAF
jgi:hypothetical protein